MFLEYAVSLDDGCRPRLPRVAKSRECSGLQVRRRTSLVYYDIYLRFLYRRVLVHNSDYYSRVWIV